MIAGDPRPQRRHQLGRQGAALGHAVEQAVLVEAAHDDQPVDGGLGRFADLAQHQFAVAAAPHGRRHRDRSPAPAGG